MPQAFLAKLYEAIEAHLEDPHFGAEELARVLGMSHSTLLRRVRALTGKSINQLIREVRLKKAWELIHEQGLNISEVAFRLGFNSPAYFTARFHEFYGYPPGDIRRNQFQSEAGNGQAIEKPAMVPVNDPPVLTTSNTDPPSIGALLVFGRQKLLVGAGILFFAIILTGIILALLGNSDRDLERRITSQARTIEILPFENLSGDSLTGVVCSFFRLELQSSMVRIKKLKVKSIQTPNETEGASGQVRLRGHPAQPNYQLRGSIARFDDRLKIWVSMAEVRSSTDIWTYDTVAGHTDLLAILQETTRSIANELKLKTTAEEIREAIPQQAGTKNRDALFFDRQGDFYAGFSQDRNALQSSLVSYEKAIALDSQWAEPYFGAILALIETWWFYVDRSPSVLEKCRKYLVKSGELAPNTLPWTVSMGDYQYRGLLDYGKALFYFDKALQSQPDHFLAMLMHGNVYRRMGEWNKALNWYMATHEKHSNGVTYFHVGETLRMMREFDESNNFLEKLGALRPDHVWGCWQHALVHLYGQGNPADALEILEKAGQLNYLFKDDSLIVETQIIAGLCLGKYAKARESLERTQYDVFQTQSYFRPRELYLAWISELTGDAGEAEAHYRAGLRFLEPLIAKYPDDHRLYSAQGIMLAGLGDSRGAVQAGKKAISLMPLEKDAYRAIDLVEDMARIYLKLGLHREALRQLEIALSHPGNLNPAYIRVDPRWKPILGQPGYVALERRLAGI